MVALFFAMVVLQGAVPDAVVTPSASLGQSIAGKSAPDSLGLTQSTATFGEVSIVAGCTYGAPALTSSALGNLTDLSRTLTMPQCTDPVALASPMLVPTGTFARVSGYPILLEPDSSAPGTHMTFVTRSVAPTKSFSFEHFVVPEEFKASVGPATAAVRSVPPPAVASRPPNRR